MLVWGCGCWGGCMFAFVDIRVCENLNVRACMDGSY